jgi:hypothetical protein
MRADSAIWRPTVRIGLSAVRGSWKTMPISRRAVARARGRAADQLASSQRMLPDAVAPSGRRPRIASAVSDFPEPTRR